MSDKIVNFYDKLGIKGAILPKTFKRHHMFNKSHTLCLGGTGSGKSNALINYISRSSGEFYKIIVCSFSTTDEPLYNMLEETGKIELISDIEEVPDLEEYDNEQMANSRFRLINQFTKMQKERLVRTVNLDWIDLTPALQREASLHLQAELLNFARVA